MRAWTVTRSFNWLTAAGALVAAGMLVLGAFVLSAARDDAWQQAQRDLDNLSVTLEREISRNIAVYDLSLLGAQSGLKLPGIGTVSPEIRQAALFDQAASADYLGSMLILDRAGHILADSTALTPHHLSFADRDYFTVHQARPDAGLYVSLPFHSRLRNGDPSVAISRRIDTADGQFGGVVVGTLRLAYFDSLFTRLNLGKNGAITLLRTDGRLLARLPHRADDMERVLGAASQAGAYLRTGQRETVGRSETDGVERLAVFRPVGNLPLVLAVSASTETILAPWWHRSLAIAAALGLLSAAVVVLCWLFERALRSRVAAERRAVQFADQLALLATTDALTGLANRGAFNARLDVEWRRCVRTQTSLAVLMIDADQFKRFNDRYGHLEGDRVLQAIAGCMNRRSRRPADLCARFGGEEFVILLPETELEGARIGAEGLRADIVALALEHEDSDLGTVSVSIGVAAMQPARGGSAADLVRQADAALYAAKHAGRNRVMTGPLKPALVERPVARTA